MVASIVPSHIIGLSDESKRNCGTMRQPWTIEAPIGQKIRITLLDFSASKSGEMEGQLKQPCHSYGVIVDKGNKRNVSICGGGAHRERELYTSTGNLMEIVFNTEGLKKNATGARKFMLRIEGMCFSIQVSRYCSSVYHRIIYVVCVCQIKLPTFGGEPITSDMLVLNKYGRAYLKNEFKFTI